MKKLIALLFGALMALAQPAAAQDDRSFRQEELDQLLAPIALYPDSLLTQILIASTYPLEVIEAARWSKANPQLRGQDAVEAVARKEWDESVKSLTAFPQVLAQMDEKLDWTKRLGDAFVAQEPQVMETVQALRRRAYDAGNLRSNDNTVVTQEGDRVIIVEPANPQTVYVPYYDPWVAYGPWWYPAYPPVYWRPWPGYYAYPGFSAVFWWGAPVVVSSGFFHAKAHWAHHHGHPHSVNVVKVNTVKTVNGGQPAPHAVETKWSHDPAHRRNVAYRDRPAPRAYDRTKSQAPYGAAPQRPQPRGERSPAEQMQRREAVERTHPMPGANGWSRPEPRQHREVRQHQPRVEQPRAQPQPQARIEAPRVQPQAQPRPQPQPQFRQEAPRAQPQMRAEQPRQHFQQQPQQRPAFRAEQPRQQFQQPQRQQGGGGFRRQG